MAWGGLSISLILIFVAMAILLLYRSRRLHEQTGLPDGKVIYSDTAVWHQSDRTPHNSELRLVGKPDYLVEEENGQIIPVELKSGRAPRRPWPAHIFQLAVYCLLVEDTYGVRPSHGIIQYSDNAFDVDYTAELETELHDILAEMRRDNGAGEIARSHSDARRCAACGLREKCTQRLHFG